VLKGQWLTAFGTLWDKLKVLSPRPPVLASRRTGSGAYARKSDGNLTKSRFGEGPELWGFLRMLGPILDCPPTDGNGVGSTAEDRPVITDLRSLT